jgi:hypothetical protein
MKRHFRACLCRRPLGQSVPNSVVHCFLKIKGERTTQVVRSGTHPFGKVNDGIRTEPVARSSHHKVDRRGEA